MAKAEQESEKRKREEKWQMLPAPAKSLQNGAGFHGKTRTNSACRNENGGLSATKRAAGKYARAAFAKIKGNKAICPDHQIVRWKRIKVSENRFLSGI